MMPHSRERYVLRHFAIATLLLLGASQLFGQAGPLTLQSPTAPGASVIRLTLDDAIKQARANAAQFSAAITDAKIAHEDRIQARAALLPNLSYSTGAIYTEPNGEPTGVFIASNAVHEYISQGVVKEVLSFANVADYRRTRAAEALAKAKAD